MLTEVERDSDFVKNLDSSMSLSDSSIKPNLNLVDLTDPLDNKQQISHSDDKSQNLLLTDISLAQNVANTEIRTSGSGKGITWRDEFRVSDLFSSSEFRSKIRPYGDASQAYTEAGIGTMALGVAVLASNVFMRAQATPLERRIGVGAAMALSVGAAKLIVDAAYDTNYRKGFLLPYRSEK